ncbi:hypothetical protein Tco_1022896 [Tanacetum coccineum]
MENAKKSVRENMSLIEVSTLERGDASLCTKSIPEAGSGGWTHLETVLDSLGADTGYAGDLLCGDLGQTDSFSAVFLFGQESHNTFLFCLNKLGDLEYYEGDLQDARDHYFTGCPFWSSSSMLSQVDSFLRLPSQSVILLILLYVVNNTLTEPKDSCLNINDNTSDLVLDLAVSLAKVADVDRNLDAEDTAIEGFQEAITLLKSLKINSEENALEQRRLSVLDFLNNQLSKKQSD